MLSHINGKEFQLEYYLINSPKHPIILGYPWLRKHNPEINWESNTPDSSTYEEIPSDKDNIHEEDNDTDSENSDFHSAYEGESNIIESPIETTINTENIEETNEIKITPRD
ncbi:hypothetical protein AYI69_g895, partial [Smittium culicis]